MPRVEDGGHEDHYLSELVQVRFTPNDVKWLDAQARTMNPPVTRAYIIRTCVIMWRRLAQMPLIDILGPLSEDEKDSIRGHRVQMVIAPRRR